MKLKILTLTTCFLIVVSCSKNNDEPSKSSVKAPVDLQLPEKAGDVINKSNRFGMELFKQVAIDEPEKNLMLSPVSASVALTMLLNGCDGETYNQIRDMLGYSDLTFLEINEVYRSLVKQLLLVDPDVKLALANAVWYRQDFAVYPAYLQSMEDVFDATVDGLDFNQPSAVDVINQWAADNTNGRITNVIGEISPETMMFLMNALWFKGSWTWKFDPDQTTDGTFVLDDGTQVTTPLMSDKIPVKRLMENAYSCIELFYGRQNFSMIIVVPHGSLNDLIENMGNSFWPQMTAALDQIEGPEELEVKLPKFSFDYEKRLNDQLQALGMTDAFVPSVADLSKIADTDLFVSFVKQNSFVEVNEEGTEAAAVTTIGIEVTSFDGFVVNSPFIFAIRERTSNTLMFVGKVMDPTDE